MHQTIHSDTAAALAAWDKGDPIRSIYLGHTQKQIEPIEGQPHRIDFNTPPHRNRQDLAHAWCFAIIQYFLDVGFPQSFEEFETIVAEMERQPRESHGDQELSREEKDGAESLAWKALMIGWDAAIDGLPATRYLQVRRPGAGRTGSWIEAT